MGRGGIRWDLVGPGGTVGWSEGASHAGREGGGGCLAVGAEPGIAGAARERATAVEAVDARDDRLQIPSKTPFDLI